MFLTTLDNKITTKLLSNDQIANDLKSKDAITVVDNIAKAKETIKTISPKTKVLISTLTNRYDNEELEHKVTALNEEIKRSFQTDVIDNRNLDKTCVIKVVFTFQGKEQYI